MTDILLAAILLVLVLGEVREAHTWYRAYGSYWRKRLSFWKK